MLRVIGTQPLRRAAVAHYARARAPVSKPQAEPSVTPAELATGDPDVDKLNATAPYERQSKLAEFGDYKIGMTHLPPELKRSMRRMLKDRSPTSLRDDARRIAESLQTFAPMTRMDLLERGTLLACCKIAKLTRADSCAVQGHSSRR